MKYCDSIYQVKRWKTREVMVGGVGVGGDNPVRIQSMTTSDTRDAPKTIEQIMRLADVGCEIARVTVQGKKEAESCEAIKNGLVAKGYNIPVVADIHFYPPAAMLVAQFVDKIRVNPGNFVDRRASFKVIDYDDAAYALEIEKIEEGFAPLVQLCKRLKKAIRIGTNHGSLSDRIMNRYGDTPRGMVESAFEFARVCRRYDYHDFIFSMKASNPVVMIQAYRLLVAEMKKIDWNYPLHLGVTEAGEGEDGRVKSSIGIGTLLLDGLGDTIRVSLTEDPWAEIDPCKRLVSFAEKNLNRGIAPFIEKHRHFEDLRPRKTTLPRTLHRDGTVLLKVDSETDFNSELGCKVQLGQFEKGIDTPDILWFDTIPPHLEPTVLRLQKAGIGILTPQPFPNAIRLSSTPLSVPYALHMRQPGPIPEGPKPQFIVFEPSQSPLHETRLLIDYLYNIDIPVILALSYTCSAEDLPIHAGAEAGACLSDKLAEGICLLSDQPADSLRKLSFNLLQGARMRTTKTDFISCPGCGRTLFDLQEVSRRIREKTAHLPGVKIAIMGCIVNGPGEMADADFGYVGSRPEKIDLYVGKTCVEKNIDFADADLRLIELIKAHGKWKDPEEATLLSKS
ncbi:MAG: (E)-4-hydroxy-3-methylbut-2-enyl-diphosphate synthase [Verrucomicrobia bacterium]|nr:(E)-4-hydroxy-3-methylbut-2-enyl-diphosphate synthase [Verrucomicrobiota bacterium]